MNSLTIDRSIVTAGWPSEPGPHLLWSEESGWPVISVVWVEVTVDGTTFWKGSGGTDRVFEIPRLFGMWHDGYCGHSRITPEAIRYYEEEHAKARAEVLNIISRGGSE